MANEGKRKSFILNDKLHDLVEVDAHSGILL
jgi:hypothetical protein